MLTFLRLLSYNTVVLKIDRWSLHMANIFSSMVNDWPIVVQILNELGQFEGDLVSLEAGGTVVLPTINLTIHGAKYGASITLTREAAVAAYSPTPVAVLPATAPAAPAAKTYTQAQVDAMVAAKATPAAPVAPPVKTYTQAEVDALMSGSANV
jgi:hypothetical protein